MNNMNKSNSPTQGVPYLMVLVAIFFIAVSVGVGWYLWKKRNTSNKWTDFSNVAINGLVSGVTTTQTSLDACKKNCDATKGCDAVHWVKDKNDPNFQKCYQHTAAGNSNFYPSPDKTFDSSTKVPFVAKTP